MNAITTKAIVLIMPPKELDARWEIPKTFDRKATFKARCDFIDAFLRRCPSHEEPWSGRSNVG